MSVFYKIIFKLGIFYRNPSLNRFYRDLLDSDKASLDQIRKIQERKFTTFIDFVFNYSPYYKQKFADLGIVRQDIKSLRDLYKLPVLDKRELRENAEKITSQYPFKKVFISETSGTSGQPLKFNKDEEWDSMNRAALFRGYSWYGVNPWDKNGYFWGYNIAKKDRRRTEISDRLQNRFRIFSYREDEIQVFVKKLRNAKFIGGYSSMIYEVAKRINRMPEIDRPKNLHLVKGTSEKIYDNYHQEAIQAFGSKIRSEYGAAEAGIIAFECPEGFMHINSENVIVEELNGEIFITNLMSKSFPIIRYKLGDTITLAPDNFSCRCGRHHPVILEIMGRVGKNVIGYNNSYPSLTFYYVFKNLALNRNLNLNYQAIQNVQGKVLLKVEQDDPETEKFIRKELDKYFGNDIDFEIIFSVTLHEMGGKLKDFITTLE